MSEKVSAIEWGDKKRDYSLLFGVKHEDIKVNVWGDNLIVLITKGSQILRAFDMFLNNY